jgi:hypothetical protein
MPTPTLMLPTKQKEEVLAFIQQKIQLKTDELEQLKKKNQVQFSDWVVQGNAVTLSNQTIPQKGLIGHYTFQNNLKNLID